MLFKTVTCDVIIINRLNQVGVQCRHVNRVIFLNCILMNEKRQQLIITSTNQIQIKKKTDKK